MSSLKPGRSQFWRLILIGIAISAVIFVALVLLALSGNIPARAMVNTESWVNLMHLTGVVAAIGSIYGSIVMLDSRSGQAVSEQPALRTILCGIFGAFAVLIVWAWPLADFHSAWVFSGIVTGSILGWFGWGWAWIFDYF